MFGSIEVFLLVTIHILVTLFNIIHCGSPGAKSNKKVCNKNPSSGEKSANSVASKTQKNKQPAPKSAPSPAGTKKADGDFNFDMVVEGGLEAPDTELKSNEDANLLGKTDVHSKIMSTKQPNDTPAAAAKSQKKESVEAFGANGKPIVNKSNKSCSRDAQQPPSNTKIQQAST